MEQTEDELYSKLLADIERLIKRRAMPYVKQSELLEDLGISKTYLEKLQDYGLKRVILEEGDRTVWYSYEQLTQVMDKLAE